MKLALAALMVLTTLPAYAGGPRIRYQDTGDYSNYKAYESQKGYAREEKCYRNEYREEYVPGTSKSPGYVKTYRERVKVPCQSHMPQPSYSYPESSYDDNSCIEGSILGGIAGGGIGAAASRGDGRWWAIPLGIVSGSMVGCQMDGG